MLYPWPPLELLLAEWLPVAGGENELNVPQPLALLPDLVHQGSEARDQAGRFQIEISNVELLD